MEPLLFEHVGLFGCQGLSTTQHCDKPTEDLVQYGSKWKETQLLCTSIA